MRSPKKNLKPIPSPKFTVPSGLPSLSFVTPKKERQEDGISSTNVVKTSNFGLLISRYIPLQAINNQKEDAIIEINRSGRDVVYQTLRSLWFEHLADNFTAANRDLTPLIDASCQRWFEMTEGGIRFRSVCQDRMVIGLGGKGALEFGITLHRITGLPFIPGTALKGVCRNFQLLKIAEKRGISPLPPHTESNEFSNKSKEKNPLDRLEEELIDHQSLDEDAKLYRRMFGTQDAAGEIVFFDAVLWPLNENQSIFDIDVMTPHFSSYYQSGGEKSPNDIKPPDDADNPVPINFVTVPAQTTFCFAVGLRNSRDNSLLNQAVETLQQALAELGIGAKTAAGYGIFGSPELIKPIKKGIEVGDEISGEVFDIEGGIWFEPDETYTFGKEYEAHIPPHAIQKRRNVGERVKARVIEVKGGDPIRLICEQIVEGRK